MSILDKIQVGSTTYDLQDSKATADIVDLKSARIALAGRVTTAESDIDTLETHKVAQPLDEYNQPTDGTNGQSLRTKGDGTTEWVDVGLPTDEQTAQAVSDWLDAHPEATTTVQDGSLTEVKFADVLKLKTIKDYVTPQMFGAKADGVTNDSSAIYNAIKYAVTNNNHVYVPEGTYAIYNNAIFQTESFGYTCEGLIIRGAGKERSILKLITEGSEKWFWDSSNVQNFMRTTFIDIGFSTDDVTKGNGFKQYSTGVDKQLWFMRCRFTLNTVLHTTGTGNSDLNRFIACLFTTYGNAFISENSQSVDNIILACGGLIYGNFFRILTGGNFKVLGGAFDLYAYNNDSTVKYLVDATGSSLSHGNGDITFDCVRFEFHGEKAFFTGESHTQINVLFRRCSIATTYGSLKNVANVYDNNILTFFDCALTNNLGFTVNSSFLSGSTTSGAILKFDSCNLGGSIDFSENISKTGDSYTIIATKCYRANGASSTRSAQDFVFTSKNTALSGLCEYTKTATLKPTGMIFPTPNGSNDVVLAVPKGIYIKRIYLYKPAIAASSKEVIFYIGNDDKTVIIAQTGAGKTWNDEIILDESDIGVFDYNRIKMWCTSEAGPGISSGRVYIEYV